MSSPAGAVRRRHHPYGPAVVLLVLTALAVALTPAGRVEPFAAWVLMGVAAGYSISASV